jgi:predicted HTH domain antitoxin
MQITVELPDDIAQHDDPGREALEAFVIAGFRKGTLTHYQSARLLGLDRYEFDGFLKQREIYDWCYNEEDLAKDIDTINRLFEEGKFPR